MSARKVSIDGILNTIYRVKYGT